MSKGSHDGVAFHGSVPSYQTCSTQGLLLCDTSGGEAGKGCCLNSLLKYVGYCMRLQRQSAHYAATEIQHQGAAACVNDIIDNDGRQMAIVPISV